MFKKQATGLVVLTYLSGEVQAIKNRFRPIDGTVPWHKDISDPTWTTPDWPVDYFVPDFGRETDMINVNKSIKGAEKSLKKKLNASWAEDKAEKDMYAANPRDYFVPDFGVDHDIKDVQKEIQDAETTLGQTMTANFGQKDDALLPRNYVVPGYGPDPDMVNVKTSIDNTEKKLKKQMFASFEEDKAKGNYAANPRDYFVPDFGVDHDIKNVQSAIKQEETILKHEWKPTQDANGFWTMPQAADNASYAYGANYINNNGPGMGNAGLIQLGDDPICSSAGCTQYKHPEAPASHPMDYPVPNFGVDHDVKVSENSEKVASKLVGHKWDWKDTKARDIVQYETGKPLDVEITTSLSNLKTQEAEKGIWELPPSNVQIESEVALQDDPICSSAGCTQYKHPEAPNGHPMDYFVPDFGKDQGIIDVSQSEKAAAKIVGKPWDWKEPAKAPPRGYFVPDFGVDEDIKNVQSSIKSEEKNIGAWNPTQDANGFWNVPEAADNSSYSYGANYINNNGSGMGNKGLAQRKSDPICSSVGCPKTAAEKESAAAVIKYATDVPLDSDIRHSITNEGIAEGLVGQKWKM